MYANVMYFHTYSNEDVCDGQLDAAPLAVDIANDGSKMEVIGVAVEAL